MPRQPRDYKREAEIETPERKKRRAMRKKARRMLTREGVVRKGDGKDVDHKKTLNSGGSNSRSNLKVRDRSSNSRQGGKMGSKSGKAKGGRK